MSENQSRKIVISGGNKPNIDFGSFERGLAEIQTPAQAFEKVKILESIQSALSGFQNSFETEFKISEYKIRYDRKLWNLLCETNLTSVELAKALNKKKSDDACRFKEDLKKAYGEKSDDDIQVLINLSYEKGKPLTREFFKSSGKSGFGVKKSGQQEWFTPRWIYERARHIMGSIDLDPATSQKAINMGNIANRYFMKGDNGLTKAWNTTNKSNIFINPTYTIPYFKTKIIKNKTVKRISSDSVCQDFLSKLLRSEFKQCVFITPQRSETYYGQYLHKLANVFFLQQGRTKFHKDGSADKQLPPDPSIIWGICVDPLKFWLAFKDFGHVECRYKNFNQLKAECEERWSEIDLWTAQLEKLPKP